MHPLQNYCRGISDEQQLMVSYLWEGSVQLVLRRSYTGEQSFHPLKRPLTPCNEIAGVSISEVITALGTRCHPAGEQQAEDGAFLRRGVEGLGALDEAVPL